MSVARLIVDLRGFLHQG